MGFLKFEFVDLNLQPLLRKYPIRRITCLEPNFPEGAMDMEPLQVMVEFEHGHFLGEIFHELEEELCQFYGRKVILLTPNLQNPPYRG